MIQFIPLGYEILFILILIGILLFSYKKIPELAKSFGRATSEFEKAKLEAKKELDWIKRAEIDNSNSANNMDRQRLEAIASTLGIDYTTKDNKELKTTIEEELNKN